MKRVALALLLPPLALLAWSVVQRSSERPALLPARAERGSLAREAVELAPGLPAAPRTRDAVAVPEPDAPPASDEERARVFGTVVDAQQRPLEGVRLLLHSAYGELRPGIVEREAFTDSRGVFLFDLPVPTSQWVTLSVHPSELLDVASRIFGHAGGHDRDPLLPGDNDVGAFVLQACGVIVGRVADERGRPVGGARVTVDGAYPGGRGRWGVSAHDGAYRVAHVPPGALSIEVTCAGYVVATHTPVDVLAGRVTPDIDVVLRIAPTVSGRVVDQDGAPVAAARVAGWDESGHGTGVLTEPDGTFVVALDRGARLTSAQAEKEHHRTWESPAGVVWEPGETDIRIVLERLDEDGPHTTTFSVLDVLTGEPIERFGIGLSHRPGVDLRWESGLERPVPIREHEGGQVRLTVDPRSEDYRIAAPGFAPRTGRVEHARDGSRTQEIRLQRGGSLVGRVLAYGEPVPHPVLRVRRARIPIEPAHDNEEEDEDEDIFGAEWTTDLDEFTGRLRLETGSADGTFRIEDLATGTYELRWHGRSTAESTLEPIAVVAGRETDLGALAAFRGGELHGRIVLPRGRSPAGLRVGLGWVGDEDDVVTTNDEGRFRFERLAAGTHALWVEEKPGVVLEGDLFPIAVGVDEIVHRDFDLADRVPVPLLVRVTLDGRPAPGLEIRVLAPTEACVELVGTTGPDGTLHGELRPVGAATVHALSPSSAPFGSQPVQIEDGRWNEVALDLASGELVLDWSAANVPAGSPPALWCVPLDAAEERGSSLRSEQLAEGARSVTLSPFPTGRFRVSTWTPDGTYAAQFEVSAGRTTRCRLEREQ